MGKILLSVPCFGRLIYDESDARAYAAKMIQREDIDQVRVMFDLRELQWAVLIIGDVLTGKTEDELLREGF